ncbi:MAG: HdeD family acid-resistance protein [Chloroflexi bacterium]|nr:HdeD family acid-resistance protein [Chloroflexota bacterium]
MLVVRGVIAILFGALAIALPGLTLVSLVYLFGAFVVVDGILNLVNSVSDAGSYPQWWVGLLEGIVGLAVGALTFIWPNLTGVALLFLIAAWTIVTGILEIVAAVHLRKEHENEWLLALGGVLSLLFGIYLVIFPIPGALAVAWLIGAYALVFGVTLIALGLRLRGNPEQFGQMA